MQGCIHCASALSYLWFGHARHCIIDIHHHSCMFLIFNEVLAAKILNNYLFLLDWEKLL